MEGRHKPRYVTLREYPSVGLLRVRIIEEEQSRLRHLDLREYRFPSGWSRYGVRIKARSEVEFLIVVLAAVLRDPLL